ncbi:MAG: redoxin domain-containing protein, partial [Gemmatimonadetes bacterium]|nr:redoxin domain-containing protein [Gemmatimonadota bacterium]
MELHHDRRTRTDIPTRASAVPDAPARARRVLLAVAAALAATLVVPGLAAGQGVGLDIGTPAPAVEVEDLDGNTVQIADYIEPGKLTLLEFWATWCEN